MLQGEYIKKRDNETISLFLEAVQNLKEKEKRNYRCQLYETAYTMILVGAVVLQKFD